MAVDTSRLLWDESITTFLISTMQTPKCICYDIIFNTHDTILNNEVLYQFYFKYSLRGVRREGGTVKGGGGGG